METWIDGEAPFMPVYAVRESAYDDWNAGAVTFVLSPLNVTMRSFTYQQKIVVVLNGEEIIFPGPEIEVGMRTTSEFTLPGYGTCEVADTVYAKVLAGVVAPGTPVVVSNGILMPASAALGMSGVALNAADPMHNAWFVSAGSVSRDDWTSIIGTTLLPTSADLALGVTPGTLVVSTGQPVIGHSDDTGHRFTFG